jgi:hypothetical protein
MHKSSINIFWMFTDLPLYISENLSTWNIVYGNRVKLWRDESAVDKSLEINERTFKLLPPASRVDLIRVLTLRSVGGWYCDADTVPGNLVLGDSKSLVLFREEDTRFCNGFFYAPKGHPFLNFWIREIEQSIKETDYSDFYAPEVTGPHALSRAIYCYALEIGAKRTREQILCGSWGFIRFRRDKQRKKVWPHRSFALEHISHGSWESNNNTIKRYLFLRETIYSLRQSEFGRLLDFARNVIVNRRLLPFSPERVQLLLNMDNRELDKIDSLKKAWRVIGDESELLPAVRNLAVGGIATENIDISKKLREAGWNSSSKGRFIRPNVTSLTKRN